jgi:hypothetical protein
METMKLNTTDLLKFNLTDFLDEVKQDLKCRKYNSKLANLQVISEIDIYSFLQKITNDFDVEKLKMIYSDICHWEWLIGGNDEDKLPYITKQIKRMIEKKMYDIIYDNTIDKLRDDKKYLNTDLEGLETFYFGGDLTKIIEIAYEAYSDAKMDFIHPLRPQPNAIKQEPPHFTRSFTPDEQRKLFDGLKNGGFLPKNANYNHFCFVFSDKCVPDNETPFEPLQWQETLSLFAYFVDKACEKYDLKHGVKRILKPFANYFNVENERITTRQITDAINDYKKTGQFRLDIKK